MKTATILRRLNVVRAVALADALLLVSLLYGLVAGRDDIAPILGPIHGGGYLLLLLLTGLGAGERPWGWWFPLLTVVTLGPPGSLYGDRRIRRSLRGAAT